MHINDDIFDLAGEQLRKEANASDDFTQRVMEQINVSPTFVRHGKASLLWSVIALAVVVIIVTTVFLHNIPSRAQPINAASAVASVNTVRFAVAVPNAESVSLAGSFNGWDVNATPMQRLNDGTWMVEVPLAAGRYVYMFVIDGKRWMPDPSAPQDASDDFGVSNSVVMVSKGDVS